MQLKLMLIQQSCHYTPLSMIMTRFVQDSAPAWFNYQSLSCGTRRLALQDFYSICTS